MKYMLSGRVCETPDKKFRAKYKSFELLMPLLQAFTLISQRVRNKKN